MALRVAAAAVTLPPLAILSTKTGRRTTRAVACITLSSADYKYLSLTHPPDTTPSDEYAAAKAATDLRVARRLLSLCQTNGGLYTKGGQYLATMRNIIPDAFTDTLVVLQNQARPSPWFQVSTTGTIASSLPHHHFLARDLRL